MKVERVQQSRYVEPIRAVKGRNQEKTVVEDLTKKDDEAVVYEPSEEEKEVTYKNPGHIYDKETVDRLKRQTEQAQGYLRQLVESLLLKQGYSIKTITQEEWESVEIDEETRAEAQKSIEPGGEFSVEAVSDRLVNFAKAISGGDIAKLETLREAIKEGFKQAEEILGELPEISKETYKRTMEKLDAWAAESKQNPSVEEIQEV